MEERFPAEEVKQPEAAITVIELNSSNPNSLEKMPVENSSTAEPSAIPKVSLEKVEKAVTVAEEPEGKGFELNSSNTSTVEKNAIEHPSTTDLPSTLNAGVEAAPESSIRMAPVEETDKASSSAIKEHTDPSTTYGQCRRLVVLVTDFRHTMPGEVFDVVDLQRNAPAVPAENHEKTELRRSKRMKTRKQIDLRRNKGQKKKKKN